MGWRPFLTMSFNHVLREANFIANSLAKAGHSTNSTTTWNLLLPTSVDAANIDSFLIKKII